MKIYLKDELELGNKILKLVLDEFAIRTKNLKSGVPIIRSNGVEEWTVLASIVVINKDQDIRVMTLTTGVKTIPELKLHKSNGMILHDLHAEILSIRAFNYILLQEIMKIRKNGEESDLITSNLEFREGLRFLMYISEPPCGDLSMELINDGGESWDLPQQQKLMRGRSNFNQVGIIRTKPGRTDSLMSWSKSCSDKLCSRQYYGFCNALTASLMNDNFKFDFLVLNDTKIQESSLQRCFNERYEGKIAINPIRVLPTTYNFQFDKALTKKPSDLSLVIIDKFCEIIGNNGLKNGRAKIELKNSSILSNASMISTFRLVLPNLTNYSDFKIQNEKREISKSIIRNDILKIKWVQNFKDDFKLN